MQRSVVGNDNRFDSFKQRAEDFVCKVLPNSPYTSTQYTKGEAGTGLLVVRF